MILFGGGEFGEEGGGEEVAHLFVEAVGEHELLQVVRKVSDVVGVGEDERVVPLESIW